VAGGEAVEGGGKLGRGGREAGGEAVEGGGKLGRGGREAGGGGGRDVTAGGGGREAGGCGSSICCTGGCGNSICCTGGCGSSICCTGGCGSSICCTGGCDSSICCAGGCDFVTGVTELIEIGSGSLSSEVTFMTEGRRANDSLSGNDSGKLDSDSRRLTSVCGGAMDCVLPHTPLPRPPLPPRPAAPPRLCWSKKECKRTELG
jgi:hypothetical protein